MNKICLYWLLLTTVWVRPAASGVIVEGTLTDPPRPVVYVSLYEDSYGGDHPIQPTLYISQWCGITVFLGNGKGLVHRYHVSGHRGGTGVLSPKSCFGIEDTPGWINWRTWQRLMIPAVQRVAVPYYDSFTTNNNGAGVPCYGVMYRDRNIYVATPLPDGCRTAPPPVSCSARTPEPIVHPAQPAGRITSEKTTPLTVSCTGNATVRVSLAPTVTLTDGTDSMGSRIYADRVGDVSVTREARPDAVIDLISVIEYELGHAGSYVGTSVISVEWY